MSPSPSNGSCTRRSPSRRAFRPRSSSISARAATSPPCPPATCGLPASSSTCSRGNLYPRRFRKRQSRRSVSREWSSWSSSPATTRPSPPSSSPSTCHCPRALPLLSRAACRQLPGGAGGCPPQTTLSGNPLGHSGPPRDCGFVLRRISPEDTGLGRTPPSPTGHVLANDSFRRIFRGKTGDSLCLGRAWRGGAGGEGAPSLDPYLLRRFRSQTPKSRGGPEWPRGLRLSVVQGGRPLPACPVT